jgi:hypothetical protein
MTVSFVTGKLGAGKGKFAILQLLNAAKRRRRIAGNVDLYLDQFAKKTTRLAYTRIPDKPTSRDLEALGHGNPDSYDEEKNGLLVLDELGTWLNARSFQDKDRAAVLDWLIHARKHGWDVLLMTQNEIQVDKQVRESLGEVFTRCMQLRKVRLPLIGGILATLSDSWGYLPRCHLAVTRIGTGATSFVADRLMYRGDYLHAMYDTRQIFRADPEAVTVTQLHPRYFDPTPPRTSWFANFIGRVPTGGGVRSAPPTAVLGRALKPKHPLIALIDTLPAEMRVAETRRLVRLGLV